MNQKNVNDLDPKLREAYERVMGTTFAPNSQPQQATLTTPPTETVPQNQPLMQTAPAPEPAPPEIQSIPVQPPAPTNPILPPLPSQNPFIQTPEPPPTVLAQAGNFPAAMQQPAGKKRGIMPILFVIGGLIFFVAYAFIWTKVFGLF